MPTSLPAKPDLSEADVLLLQQLACGALYGAISRATGIEEAKVGNAILTLLTKIGTKSRFHATALGAGWGLVEDVHVMNPTGNPPLAKHVEVLAGLVGGEDAAITAERLGLTVNTVKTYTQTVLRTLGVRSREQATAAAVLGDLVPLRTLGVGWPAVTLSKLRQQAKAG
ncbi:LuxR C-terminal-related transcriptional regulator [Streptomyces sp. LS1784]|uniref:LuxR C-terminal-related transcriptional regulator n=1 Tax=Streptomyces sp. LS1784 TaxID=2851533 RepID=UPI001CCF0B16|nr:LuxR C-terminal-related transcriptional regulator [Streptomyces sp. LS1784]